MTKLKRLSKLLHHVPPLSAILHLFAREQEHHVCLGLLRNWELQDHRCHAQVLGLLQHSHPSSQLQNRLKLRRQASLQMLAHKIQQASQKQRLLRKHLHRIHLLRLHLVRWEQDLPLAMVKLLVDLQRRTSMHHYTEIQRHWNSLKFDFKHIRTFRLLPLTFTKL